MSVEGRLTSYIHGRYALEFMRMLRQLYAEFYENKTME